MATVEVNGVEFGYDEAGEGPAVILIHAGLANRRMWDDQIRVLSETRRVIRYDWRGYGESGDADGEVAHYEDLLALMDALDVCEAALVGCSMGGAHAIDVALAAPERVTRLGLVASWVHGYEFPPHMLEVLDRFPSGVPKDRLAAYTSHAAGSVDPADIAAMAEKNVRVMVVGPDREVSALDPAVWKKSVEMARGVFERMWNGPVSTERDLEPAAIGRLGEIAVPTLVVNGGADINGVQEVADMFVGEDGIRNAERIDIPDTGHLAPLERPDVVTRALQRFLMNDA